MKEYISFKLIIYTCVDCYKPNSKSSHYIHDRWALPPSCFLKCTWWMDICRQIDRWTDRLTNSMIFSRSTLKLQVLEKAVFWNPWIQLVNSLMYSEGRWKMLNICPDIFDSLWYMNIKSRGWHRGVIRIFDVNSLIKSKLKALEM